MTSSEREGTKHQPSSWDNTAMSMNTPPPGSRASAWSPCSCVTSSHLSAAAVDTCTSCMWPTLLPLVAHTWPPLLLPYLQVLPQP
jgi:hypothetical protein